MPRTYHRKKAPAEPSPLGKVIFDAIERKKKQGIVVVEKNLYTAAGMTHDTWYTMRYKSGAYVSVHAIFTIARLLDISPRPLFDAIVGVNNEQEVDENMLVAIQLLLYQTTSEGQQLILDLADRIQKDRPRELTSEQQQQMHHILVHKERRIY